MKITTLLMLLFLLSGCMSEKADVVNAEKTPQVHNELTQHASEDETEAHILQTELPADTETDAVEPEIPAQVHRYTDILTGETADFGLHQKQYTFNCTKIFSDGTAEEQYRAVGTVTMEQSDMTGWHWYTNEAVSSKDERLRYDSILYSRLLSDACLYDADSTVLDGDGGGFVSYGTELTLDAQTALTGTTKTGVKFCVYASPFVFGQTGENGTEYHVFFDMHGGKMAYFTMYTYEYDDAALFETVYLPMIESVRTWISEEGAFPVMYAWDAVFSEEDSEPWLIAFALPDTWLWANSSVISDAPRQLSGRYATKRMEFYGLSDRIWNEPAPDAEGPSYEAQYTEEERGTLESGQEYILYRRESVSEGERIGVTWYICEYLLSDSEWRYRIAYLTFEDDPEGYLDGVVRPVMHSVRFYRENAQE